MACRSEMHRQMLDFHQVIRNVAADNGLAPEELLEACRKRQRSQKRNRKRQQAERDRDRGELLPSDEE